MMKRGKKKKGLSTIVVTILLIGLAIVAVGIVWAVVSKILNSGTEGIDLGMITLNLKIIRVEVNDAGGVDITVYRGSGGGDVDGLKFIIYDGVNTQSFEHEGSIEEFEQQTINVPYDGVIKSVSVVPLVISDSGEKSFGNIIDTFEITSGGGTGNEGNDNPLGCIPDCTGIDGILDTADDLKCGLAPNCGQTCGNCNTGAGEVCTNHVCVPDNCPPETSSVTCGTWSCGTRINNCGVEVACGDCDSSEECILGTCTPNLILSGIVDSVWPTDAPRYFDSSQLPKDGNELDLILKYINFSADAEAGNCIRILRAEYVDDLPLYDKTHLQLERIALISSGESYNIWRTSTCR